MLFRTLLATPLLLLLPFENARADDFVTCESRDNRYQSCTLPRAGYVTLDRKLSGADCRQGGTWDYDRREVWVDDGCRASFLVHGARHTSYVPGWMIGEFEGYNPTFNADIRMRIDSDGRMSAQTRGQTLNGWINGGQLNVGSSVFDISQSRDGFVTTEVGDRQNEVRYRRVR